MLRVIWLEKKDVTFKAPVPIDTQAKHSTAEGDAMGQGSCSYHVFDDIRLVRLLEELFCSRDKIRMEALNMLSISQLRCGVLAWGTSNKAIIFLPMLR